MAAMVKEEILNYSDDEDESFSDDGDWGDWKEDGNGVGVGEEEEEEGEDDGSESDFVCLFCDSRYVSCDSLFEHCRNSHGFDFHGIRTELKLDFYASFKLINYIRSQVAENKDWSWGIVDLKDVKCPWDEEKYLKPFWQEDSLLYSFADDEEDEDEEEPVLDREELMEDLKKLGNISIDDDEVIGESSISNNDKCSKDVVTQLSKCNGLKQSSADDLEVNEKDAETDVGVLRACDGRLVGRNIRKVDENYFGSYSSFGIHKEMLSDKVMH